MEKLLNVCVRVCLGGLYYVYCIFTYNVLLSTMDVFDFRGVLAQWEAANSLSYE